MASKEPEPAPDLSALDDLDQTPAEFRAEMVARIQRQARRFMARLERDGEKIPIGSVSINAAIMLTKHQEMTSVAPPASVHNQSTLVNGLSQADARAVLAGKFRAKQAPSTKPEQGTGTAPESGQVVAVPVPVPMVPERERSTTRENRAKPARSATATATSTRQPLECPSNTAGSGHSQPFPSHSTESHSL